MAFGPKTLKGGSETPEAARRRAETLLEGGDPAGAFSILLELAKSGDAEAAFKVGLFLEQGLGALQNFADAAEWYHKAADLGWTAAAGKLGDIYFSGRHVAPEVEPPDEPTAGRAGVLQSLTTRPLSVRQDFKAAAFWNEKAAADGDPRAQVRLAYQYAAGLGVGQNFKRAAKWFYDAALQKDPAGQLGVGMILAGGHGRPRDAKTAAEWFRRSAAQGNANAKLCLAVLLTRGDGINVDLREAAQLLEEAAEDRLPEAMFLLGEQKRLGVGGPVDDSAAETWLKRAALQGHTGALHALAGLFLSRRPPDFTSAASYLREAAELGHGPSQFALAELYARGRGVPQDGKLAAQWFEKAGEQGVTAAYERLGALYADGLGLEQDFAAAALWFGKAADAGGRSPDFELAVLHHYGRGVPQDLQKALELYRRASRAGDPRASLRLGVLVAEGQDVPQNWEEAAKYYGLAAAQGSEDAEINLAYLMVRNLAVGTAEDGIKVLEEAAESGSAKAVWSLYALFSSGTYVPKDEARADRWLAFGVDRSYPRLVTEAARRLRAGEEIGTASALVLERLKTLAEAGETDCQALYGLVRWEGKLGPKDGGDALVWMTRAGARGSAFAQAWLGDVLSRGEGCEQDPVEAARWYELAAAQGHTGALLAVSARAPAPGADPKEDEALFEAWLREAERGDALAQRMVGHFLVHGERCTRDLETGAAWLRRAAAQKNEAAQLLLASLIAGGEVRPDGSTEVLKLLTEAAEHGNPIAFRNLGHCYEAGAAGLPKDLDAALLWYRRSASSDDREAQEILFDRLSKRPDAQSQAEAERWRLVLKTSKGGDASGAPA